MIRKPAVAGLFYEIDPNSLIKQIEWCFQSPLGPGSIPEIGNKRNIKGVIAPHAGYIYSGSVAAHSYSEIAKDGFPETFIILCPNHTGMGSGISAMNQGSWETPLGLVDIDSEFADLLIENTTIIDVNSDAHIKEHSAEVQLPFLQYFKQDFQFIPITMWMQNIETATEIGDLIHKTANKLGRDVVVIASTDLTHYQPQYIAEKQDIQVINAIKAMDEKLMMNNVKQFNISMCGYGPVAGTIFATKKMGATNCQIEKYATSGDTTGDKNSVVAYLSAVFR
ncbi:MAG: AmmeMemoRadiSam system protein B [Methanobacterium sp.]|nr:AmmeMemoRadiSam system protein B [Methanobacterium sp.]